MAVPRITLGAVLLFTNEFDTAATFIRETVDLQLHPLDSHPDPHYRGPRDTIAFDTGWLPLAIFNSEVHAPSDVDWRREVVLAFETDDLAAARELLCERGADAITAEIDQDWGTFLYLKDPTGRPFQLYKYKERTEATRPWHGWSGS